MIRHRFVNFQKVLARLPQTPEDIAQAFALGAFCSVIPFIGPFLALTVAIRLRLSKAITLIGTLIINPWTAPLLYTGGFHIGGWFLHRQGHIGWHRLAHFETGWWAEVGQIAGPIAIGNFILGTLFALVSYYGVLYLVRHYTRCGKR